MIFVETRHENVEDILLTQHFSFFTAAVYYDTVQVSPTSWLVVRTEVKTMKNFPHLRPEGVPESFKGPPQFKETHTVNLLLNDVLVCSCGLKDRYGIPCRHLFALEPEYDIGNIHYRYQTAYAYFGYHPDHRLITKAFKERHLLEHGGIRRKNLVMHRNLPYLGTPSTLCLQDILAVRDNNVPVCWNYLRNEYPNIYQDDTCAQGDLTQETMIQAVDNDGVPDTSLSTANVIDLTTPPRQNINVPEGHDNQAPDNDSDSIQSGNDLGHISEAQLLTKFKTVMSCHRLQRDRLALWKMLAEAESNKKRDLIQREPRLVGSGDPDMVSLHLPINQQRESNQYVHPGRKDGRKKRKR